MAYQILGISSQQGYFVVNVAHHKPDGSLWFYENYVWQGSEGVNRERAVNAGGELMLNDGTVAPYDALGNQYRPEEKEWSYTDEVLLTQDSILSVIDSTHNSRMAQDWPTNTANNPVTLGSTGDVAGADALAALFNTLTGAEYMK